MFPLGRQQPFVRYSVNPISYDEHSYSPVYRKIEKHQNLDNTRDEGFLTIIWGLM
ncbi:Uncharacterised protein [Mycobacteroides abscessus subsp. bolletii]|uniref:hypothetical protein n=1 Tax=Mycobacteroides abscessus TaxID=36809 RepID=UPI0009271211|nr:hypothetical protein [Mycobacteroides abscessus]SIJ06110.1 Uncharacterised protein [Mycobacteroides abscessus subsp. bolletii]SLD78656.1 Uncharacterised protein [Mycobacteroides abscessus subsp. bolletii]SLD85881.1 Uncharacterised protein [Mycobacteroides abscessus subsp. bolletii]